MKVYQFLNRMLYGCSDIKGVTCHIREHKFVIEYPKSVLLHPEDKEIQEIYPSLTANFGTFCIIENTLHIYARWGRR